VDNVAQPPLKTKKDTRFKPGNPGRAKGSRNKATGIVTSTVFTGQYLPLSTRLFQ
jgi:hypothetical protein